MKKKVALGIMVILLFESMLALAFTVKTVKSDWTWTETIYIRADGSVDPSDAPISTVDKVTYTLTDNIVGDVPFDSSAVVVERDNIVVDGAGYTVQGTVAFDSKGIDLSYRSNVTIRNTQIKAFYYGIYLYSSSNNSVSGNHITNNSYFGICFSSSSYNIVSGNNITNNGRYGIWLDYSSNNNIIGNNITNNNYGIYLHISSNYNSISGNNIKNSSLYGIILRSSSDSTVSGNNIKNNGHGIHLYYSSNNNSISGNNITANTNDGIYLESSSGNNISGNSITNNSDDGIYLSESSGNIVSGNNIRNNYWYGIELRDYSDNNSISGNRITNNGDDGIHLYWSSNYNAVSENNITANDDNGIVLRQSHYTIISGNSITNNSENGIMLRSSSNSTVSRNNITANDVYGVYLYESSGNTVSENNITANNGDGIYLHGYWGPCNSNTVSGNNIKNNYYGIDLYYSSNNIFRSNSIGDNKYNFYVWGEALSDFVNDIDVSNTVDGKPVCYWVNKRDLTVPSDAGYVTLVNCTRITVKNLNLANNGQGILLTYSNNTSIRQNSIKNNSLYGICLYYSSNNNIVGNNITNNSDDGIHLYESSGNTLSGNNIKNNDYGIWIWESSNNVIYSNNFVNNADNAYSGSSSNIWNSPQPIAYMYGVSEWVNYLGNYWSDYSGIDTNNDGIGDTAYNINAERDYYPLMQPSEAYSQTPTTTESIMNETASTTHALTETIVSQNATLNTSVTGDFDATLIFTNLEIVLINSGSFAGKGFSKGAWSTSIEGSPYQGSWHGMLFKKPEERKIFLKGMVSGGLKGIVEGFLSESVNGSNIYDQYQATWTISHIGAYIVFAKLNLNGTVNYQENVEYSSELYALQTLIQGQASGYYDGSLSVVLTHVRIDNSTNPYYGEGFSIISYVSESGSGEGWTYDKTVSPNIVEMNGLFTDPLMGIISGELDETGASRTLSVAIERINIGLPPEADLKVKAWGPERVSPGQTVNYVIEYRNDGLKAADDVVVFNSLDPLVKYLSASAGAVYDEFYHEVSWNLGEVPTRTSRCLNVQVEVSWGLPWGTELHSSAYIVNVQASNGSVNLAANGINHNRNKQPAGCKKWNEFSYLVNAVQVPNLYGSGSGWQDVIDVQKATPQPIIGYDDGKPIVSYDPQTGEPIYALPGYLIIPNMLNDDVDYLVYPNENNGLSYFVKMGKISVDTAFAYSGGTRTVLTAILNGNLECNRLVLISPMSGAGYWGHWKREIEQIRQKHPDMEIVIYQSRKDRAADPIAGKIYDWIYQVKFSKDDVPWLKKNNIKVNPGTKEFAWDQNGDGNIDPFPPLNVDGRIIDIDENEINKQNHSGLFKYINDILQGKEGTSSSTSATTAVAHDPNIKYGSEGYVSAGQKLDYKVEFENEGEGIAFGVYFTDTLDEDLDDSTLEIGSVISTKNGSVIADPGTYNPSTRTITWLVGEVGPGESGYANFSAKVRNDVPDYTEIINFAKVYFPSVPETTRTNAIVSVVGQPNIAVTNITALESIIEKGSTLNINVTVANEGYFPETFNLTLYANTTVIQTQNITLIGRSNGSVIFVWNTTDFVVGNYTISAHAQPVLNEEDMVDNTHYSQTPVEVIPEFPSLIILPLFMTATLLAVIVCRRMRHTEINS